MVAVSKKKLDINNKYLGGNKELYPKLGYPVWKDNRVTDGCFTEGI